MKRILAVGIDRELFGKFDRMLDRSHFAPDWVRHGESALILCDHVPFDLMIVGHPLPDMELAAFLTAVRREDSPCAASPLLLLAPERELATVGGLLRSQDDAALAVDEPRAVLEAVASRLLNVPHRVASRLAVRLQVRLGEAGPLILCQTENISSAGMLIRIDRLYPVGTRMAFEYQLPADRVPVQGEAEVVRHTVLDVESVQGVGLKFISFRGDGLKRLQEFLEGGSPEKR